MRLPPSEKVKASNERVPKARPTKQELGRKNFRGKAALKLKKASLAATGIKY